jgi:nucleoside-diphosphate-sugar epimerase
MRIFLTGLSGYLGGLLADRMAELPEVESVTGISLTAPARTPHPKVHFRSVDIRAPDLAQAVAGHDVMVHCAFVVLWSAAMPAAVRDAINVDGSLAVARAARAAGVKQFLHASSMGVYDPVKARGQSGLTEDFPLGGENPDFYYWSNKAKAERLIEDTLAGSAVRLTSLRSIYIIGPRNRATVPGLRANAVNLWGHDPRRQFIHEDDVADAFLLALRRDMPGAFNVVPDDFLRMSQVWKLVGARFVPTIPRPLAAGITWARWRFLGSPVHPSWVNDMLVDFTGSNARLKRVGWLPRYSSEAALRSAVEATGAK